MKTLKEYIKEGLFDDIDKREKMGGLEATADDLKSEIINWIVEHCFINFSNNNPSKVNPKSLTVDISTTPPTVIYKTRQTIPMIRFKNTTTVNNNGVFQWGDMKAQIVLPSSIEDLTGLPKELRGSISWNYKDFGTRVLKSLKGLPEKIHGSLDLSRTQITSLEGCPEEIEEGFICSECNKLTSLKGAPKKVGEWFVCSECNKLTSLKGAPKEVGDEFSCSYCDSLESLDGAPKEVGGNFRCYRCGVEFTEEDVKKVSNVNGEIFCQP